MKKWFFRTSACLLTLVLLLFLGIFYLLATENGTKFLVSQAENQLDDRLHIGTSSGTLLGHLELADIVFNSPAGKGAIAHLLLDWKPAELFKLHLHVVEFSAADVSFSSTPAQDKKAEEKNSPLSLPELILPVTVSVEKLLIDNFVFTAAPDAEPTIVEKAELALLLDKNGIQLQKLQINIPKASLLASGHVNPIEHYPLQLTTEIKTLSPDLPSLTILGEYSGDLNKLELSERLSGDISADLNITVLQILDELHWQGDLEIKELQPSIFAPQVPGALNGKIKTSGNLQQATLTGALSMRDTAAVEVNWDADFDLQADLETLLLQINRLTLKQDGTTALIELSGITDTKGSSDISLRWQELQWPITGEPEYTTKKGTATIKGPLDGYHLIVSAEIAGKQIPEASLELTADGNSESAEDLTITANLLEGAIDLKGDVQWAPVVNWQLSFDGKNINPGAHYNEWPGNLDWLIKTDGTIENNKVTANVTINDLKGNLRNLPVAGKGKAKIKAGDISVSDLRLSSGRAVVTADGHIGDNSNLRWLVNIEDFSDLLPDSSGRLEAKGTIQGKMAEPKIELQLKASSIALKTISLEQLQADANLDLSWQTPFNLNLSATKLKSGANLLEMVTVQSNGTMEQHEAHLEASHELADISLGLKGGYSQNQWQGVLDNFNLESKDLGDWNLLKTAKIIADETAAQADSVCLNREDAVLCVHGSWDKEKNSTKAGVDLTGFPLTWLSPWFPETVQDLTGIFSLKATADIEEQIKADAVAVITPGTISYLTEKTEGSLPHEGMKLDLHVADKALDADLLLSLDSNTIRGSLQSPNLLQPEIGNKAKLGGKIFIDAKKLDLVETLVPDVQDLKGGIDADFQILGTLGQPDIKGSGKIFLSSISIPVAGLDFTDTTLDILAKNKNIQLKGKFISPGGFLELDGKAMLDSSQQWPAHFTLKGDNFRVIDLPEIQVFLSSDLLLEKKKDLLSLTGDLTIPKAEILLRDFPKGAKTVSPDVKIIQEIEEEEVKAPFQMKLKLALGDEVHFVGLGLNAFIDGQLKMTAEPGKQLLGSGAFQIKQGSYRAYGQDLQIETGVISFPGGPLSQPGINLRATRTVGDVMAGIYAIGPASKPRLTTFSNPPMSESQTISYLLTGTTPSDAGKGAALSTGRQINNKLSVSAGSNVKTGDREFHTRYRLSRKTYVETTTGTNSNAADIFYTIELGKEETNLNP